jgi:hypothetical protein
MPAGHGVQDLYNEYKKHLHNRVFQTPLPEQVTLLPENFLYWIKLENPNPSDPTKWITSKSSVVLPMLEKGEFDESGFRFDTSRGNALSTIPTILTTPNCIHRNLRNHAGRGHGGIRGTYIYLAYYGKKQRRVAFTIFDARLNKTVLVSSFWTYKKWAQDCTEMPACYVAENCICACK